MCEHPQSDGAYYGKDLYDGCKYISFGDYVVLENYISEDKPIVKEVSRRAMVGEWVRVVNATTDRTNEYKNGDILQIVYRTPRNSIGKAYYKDGVGKFLNDKEYVVLEGYVPEDKPVIREVKRPAKVGEWIRIVDFVIPCSGYSLGDIFQVKKLGIDIGEIAKPYWVEAREYVVLENYTPDANPFDSKPEPEQLTPSTSMREVDRMARVGEYVKVVNATNIPRTNGKDEYANGDVLKIIACSSRYADGKADDGKERILHLSEYVVLENFDYSVFSKNEPWRKARLSDKIKVVKVAEAHRPIVNIGEEFMVERVLGNMIYTENNLFRDELQEYIIINGTNRPFRKAKVGDIVEIVDDSDHLDPQIKNGKRFKIISVDGLCVKTEGGNYLGDARERCIIVDEAVEVPFHKAKVGDKIKIIKDNGRHVPALIIGDIHEVVRHSRTRAVWTDKDNCFYDEDQEYIIIEEAPEVKRVKRSAIKNEWIEIAKDADHRVNEGEKYQVVDADFSGKWIEIRHRRGTNNGKLCLYTREYVVLENYQPK